MSGWKYVIIRSGLYEFPVIFPDKLVHADVAQAIMTCVPKVNKARMRTATKRDQEKAKPKVVAAGDVETLYVVGANGESDTLKIKARLEDSTIINGYSYLHGIVGDDA